MTQTNNPLSDEQLGQILQRLERYARFNDSQFRIPFTRIRIGVDGIIGVIPVFGETVGLILSLYLLLEAIKLKVPTALKMRMMSNVMLDWLIGLVPILGDLADIAFKANIRNYNLLKTYVEQEQQRRRAITESSSRRPVFLYILVSLLFIALSIYLFIALNQGSQ